MQTRDRTRAARAFYEQEAAKPETCSGYGSTLAKSRGARTLLRLVLQGYPIRSIVDVPCGDCNWIAHVLGEGTGDRGQGTEDRGQGTENAASSLFPVTCSLSPLRYVGYDILLELIEANRRAFPQWSFEVADAVILIPPRVDLIICRDLLQHLRLVEALMVLDNFRASGSTWLLATTHAVDRNEELRSSPSGWAWRPLNLSLHPFNLAAPTISVREEEHFEKRLALWSVSPR